MYTYTCVQRWEHNRKARQSVVGLLAKNNTCMQLGKLRRASPLPFPRKTSGEFRQRSRHSVTFAFVLCSFYLSYLIESAEELVERPYEIGC